MRASPKRVARIVLAGALGVVVASLILVLRPTGTAFESTPGAAVSPSRTDRGAAPAGARSDAREPAAEVADAETSSFAADPSAEPVFAAARQEVAPAGAAAAPDVASAPSGHAGAVDGQRDDGEGDTANEPERPLQWCFLRTHDDHDLLSDSSAVSSGSRSVRLGKDPDPAAAGGYFSSDVLWQGADATPFRGLRMEVSAHVKGTGYFQFFVRTASASDRGVVLNDNQLPSVPTTNRYVRLFPPNGADWTRLSIVADVPVESDIVYYGVSLMNGRAIWIDDVRIATVDRETPLTQEPSHGGRFVLPVDARTALAAPANLDFEITARERAGC
jgi:hypothetical protein